MKLSIIVLNYKSTNLTKYFLKTVLLFHFPWTWEIIVVDNGSADKINNLIKKDFPVVKFIQNKKNLGMGAGNNVGLRRSEGEYALIVNPDVTLREEAVFKLVDFLDHHPHAGLAAPKILNPDLTRQDTCYRWPNFFTFLFRRTPLGATKYGERYLKSFLYRDTDLSMPTQVDWVLGGCFMARRAALDAVGLFDERYFLFLEDTDLCRKMWRAELAVWYAPGSTVIHLPHRLSASEGRLRDLFSRLTWVHLFSWLKYFWKWQGIE